MITIKKTNSKITIHFKYNLRLLLNLRELEQDGIQLIEIGGLEKKRGRSSENS